MLTTAASPGCTSTATRSVASNNGWAIQNAATVALTVERRATLTDGELALRYVLENVGNRPAAAFWMAHPLFDATDLVAVEVHPGDAAVVSTVDSRQPGSAGDGTSGPLLAGDLEPGGYRKYRLGDVSVVESVTLVRSDGPRLTVGWRADVPSGAARPSARA